MKSFCLIYGAQAIFSWQILGVLSGITAPSQQLEHFNCLLWVCRFCFVFFCVCFFLVRFFFFRMEKKESRCWGLTPSASQHTQWHDLGWGESFWGGAGGFVGQTPGRDPMFAPSPCSEGSDQQATARGWYLLIRGLLKNHPVRSSEARASPSSRKVRSAAPGLGTRLCSGGCVCWESPSVSAWSGDVRGAICSGTGGGCAPAPARAQTGSADASSPAPAAPPVPPVLDTVTLFRSWELPQRLSNPTRASGWKELV